MTFDEVVAECGRRGLFVQNLFQLRGDVWQANVRDKKDFGEYWRGATPAEALQKAMEKATFTVPAAPEPEGDSW